MPHPDQVAGLLLSAALLAYAVAGALLDRGRRRAGLWLFAAGWCANALTVAQNALACGQPPFGSMYHVLVALSLCFLPAYLYLLRAQGIGWLGTSFAWASAVPLIGTLLMTRDLFWRRMPALQSPWFVPHVTAYLVAYALATVGFVQSMRAQARRRRAPAEAAELARGVDAVTRLAFPFMTFGLLSGALWADTAWGQYWSWDPKETWALVMWLCYALYLHCRRHADLKRYAGACQVAGFTALMVTFLLVSLVPRLGSVLHAYAR